MFRLFCLGCVVGLFVGFVFISSPACAEVSTEILFDANEPAQRLFMGAGPSALVVTDVNGDGRLDIVASAGRETEGPLQGIAIYAATPDGNMVGPFPRPGPQRPSDIAVGKFNDDEVPDLVICGTDSDTLTVLLGSRGGLPTQNFTVATDSGAAKIAARDFDGDGNTEVVVLSHPTSFDSAISIYDIDPETPPFLTKVAGETQTNKYWADVAFADLDGDGLAYDLLILQTGSAGNALIHHDLATDTRTETTLDTEGYGTTLLTGDLTVNDESDEDMIVLLAINFSLVPESGEALIMQESAGELVLSSTMEIGSSPADGVLSDLNGDGVLDLLTANSGAGQVEMGSGGRIIPDGVTDTVTIALGKGDGGFITPYEFEVLDIVPSAVGAGDLDGDTRPDIVVSQSSENFLHVYTGNLPSLVELPLDLHRDAQIDARDLFCFSTLWQQAGSSLADINLSGSVEKVDARIWANYFDNQKEVAEILDAAGDTSP